MKLYRICVRGAANAQLFSSILIVMSRSFKMEPLPDDDYEFVVKYEFIDDLTVRVRSVIDLTKIRFNGRFETESDVAWH
jgi:hypothetical protein